MKPSLRRLITSSAATSSSSPLRVCNAYLLDDQLRLGQGLVLLSIVVAAGVIAHVVRRYTDPSTSGQVSSRSMAPP